MDVRAELEKTGCIRTGHFVGVSGKHLAGYVNNDRLMPHVELVSQLVRKIAQEFKNDNIEVVASPAVGAIPLSHWGAHHLMSLTSKDIFAVWADKVPNTPERVFIFEREGFAEKVKGKRILLIEDIINQMASIKAMINTVQDAGGEIIGVGSLEANRGVSAEAMGVNKFFTLCNTEYDVWTPEDCSKDGLCAKGEPIVEDIGHGDDFKKANPDYAGGYVKLLS